MGNQSLQQLTQDSCKHTRTPFYIIRIFFIAVLYEEKKTHVKIYIEHTVYTCIHKSSHVLKKVD